MVKKPDSTHRRSGGRSARLKKRSTDANSSILQRSGYYGGQYRPLTDADIHKIHEGAINILETVGMGIIGALPTGAKAILESGGSMSDHDRVLIPRSLIEDALAKTCKSWTLHGLDESRSIEISPKRPHYGTAGGAVTIRDFHSGK